uniref:ELMO armadillo-like helical domain-containing protein n=1 Tax=Meloidogyne javanica TaxID=6303 RepID=A0A915N3B5_MELJA
MSSFHFSSKVLNLVDTRPKADELKGAVKLDPNLKEYLQFGDESIKESNIYQSNCLNSTTFATFNRQDQSLSDFISQLCKQFEIEPGSFNSGDKEHFGLMFDDKINFVTEQNKNLINQGFILKLTASPLNYAKYFLKNLSSKNLLATENLSLFSSLCQDFVFIEAFTCLEGIQRLIKIIEENENCQSSSTIYLGLLNILLQLMQQFPQIFPWPESSTQFVRKITFFVNGQSKLEQNGTRALALEMLLAISEHCEHLNECLKSEMPVDLLIRHLDNTNERVLISSISLINSIYVLADREERINIVKLLHEKPFISAIGRILNREENLNNGQQLNNKISSQPLPSQISPEKSKLYEKIAHFQQIRFDEVCALALRTPTDKEINFLKVLGNEFGSFDSSNSTELPSNEFSDQQTIQQKEDWLMFRKMLNTHFIMRPTVLPQILVHLTEMLVQILGICSDSSSVARRFGLSKVPRYFRLVLQLERPFYDLFRILVELFCRTWNDMNAKFDEINKVYNVVQDQFERSLFANPNSLEQLEIEMLRKRFSYFNMQKPGPRL